LGAGVGSGAGGGATVAVPPSISSLNFSRSVALKTTECEPTGRLVENVNRTPCFHASSPGAGAIAWTDPPMLTRTASGGEPSRFRYVTLKTIG
jgi:hypothetical protein